MATDQSKSNEKLQKCRRRLVFDNNDSNEKTATSKENQNSSDEDLLHELKAISEEAKAKYNFDFENEIPLEGDYEWERMPPVIPKKADELKEKLPKTEERNL